MPASPLEPSHKTQFKSTLRQTASQSHSVRISSSAAHPWPAPDLGQDHLEAHEWTYLAEGGKSLLLRFDGDAENAKGSWLNHNGTRAVALKLSKRKRARQAQADPGKAELPLDRPSFESQVVAPLIQRTTLIPFSSNIDLDGQFAQMFLERVSARVEMQRPAERRAADGIDDEQTRIEITEDLSWSGPTEKAEVGSMPVLAVEIKPKWLFGDGDGCSRTRKHAVLKANGKLDTEGWNQLYEPLDLVSKQPDRIDRAVQALVRDWRRGGNNLRLFVDGKMALGDGKNDTDLTALLKKLNPSLQARTVEDGLIPILVHCLSGAAMQAILALLAQLQQELPPCDLQSLAHWWQTQHDGQPLSDASLGQNNDLLSEPTVEEFAEYVQDWLEHQKANEGDQPSKAAEEGMAATLRQAILGTMLSATFKDCSIFLRLSPTAATVEAAQAAADSNDTAKDFQEQTATSAVESHDNKDDNERAAPYADAPTHKAAEPTTNTTAKEETSFGFNVRLIDLDPKPIGKLPHWLQLDRDIEAAWQAWRKEHGV
ncbi:unnamed protein product [Jaminaea pallidilutea]